VNFATEVWPLSLPVYYLGAPITHFAHKAPVKAAISEGLRIAVPYATGLIGAQFRHCDIRNPDTCAHGIQPGAVVGAVAVSVFDIAVLGQRSVLENVPTTPPPQTVSVYPGGTVDRHGFTLTASGTF